MSENPTVDAVVNWIKAQVGLGGTPKPGPVMSVLPPVAVGVAPTTLTLNKPSDTLTAVGVIVGGTYSWTSSAPGVVSVTIASTDPTKSTATVQRITAGTATITVTYTVGTRSALATSTITVPVRNFVIVFGEPGTAASGHNVGALFSLAAQTHSKELTANTPPNSAIPATLPTDKVTVSAIHTVSDLKAQLSVNNVQYLAFFGHGWNDTGKVGVLDIGQNHVADANLTIASNPAGDVAANTPPSVLPASAFLPGAVIFLFNCRASFGADSSAEQLATALGVKVFGYDHASNGSIFTADKTLGHGGRAVTRADQTNMSITGGDVWMVPFDGVPTFKSFP